MGEREIKAFALAPLPVVAPLLLAIGVNAVIGDTGDGGAAAIFLALCMVVLLGYGSTLVIGIPIHLLLRRFRKTGLIYYVALAALPFLLLAAATAAHLRFGPAPLPPVNPFGLYRQGGLVIRWMLAFAATASLCASMFWYAGVRQPRS